MGGTNLLGIGGGTSGGEAAAIGSSLSDAVMLSRRYCVSLVLGLTILLVSPSFLGF